MHHIEPLCWERKPLACSPVNFFHFVIAQTFSDNTRIIETQKAWSGNPLSEDSVRLFPMRCKGKTETIPDEEGNSKKVVLGDGAGFDPKKHIVPQ